MIRATRKKNVPVFRTASFLSSLCHGSASSCVTATECSLPALAHATSMYSRSSAAEMTSPTTSATPKVVWIPLLSPAAAQRLGAEQRPVCGSRRSEAWAWGCVWMRYRLVGHEARRSCAARRTCEVDCSWALGEGMESLCAVGVWYGQQGCSRRLGGGG